MHVARDFETHGRRLIYLYLSIDKRLKVPTRKLDLEERYLLPELSKM